jgi:hypothetical protein
MNYDTILAEKEIKIKNLYEKIKSLEQEGEENDKKVEQLENLLLQNSGCIENLRVFVILFLI